MAARSHPDRGMPDRPPLQRSEAGTTDPIDRFECLAPHRLSVSAFVLLWLVPTALFFVLLARLGAPFPYQDDLFYAGAAIHLAQGGELFNPWLRDHWPASQNFLVYPPFGSFLLAAHLAVFGLSAGSLSAFFMGCACATACILLVWTRAVQGPALIALSVVPLTVAAVAWQGFRMEAPGFALAVASLAILAQTDRPSLHGVGWLLAGASALTAPVTLAYLAILAPLAAFFGRTRPAVAQSLAASLVALILVCVLFHLSVSGRWFETARAIVAHAAVPGRGVNMKLASIAWIGSLWLYWRWMLAHGFHFSRAPGLERGLACAVTALLLASIAGNMIQARSGEVILAGAAALLLGAWHASLRLQRAVPLRFATLLVFAWLAWDHRDVPAALARHASLPATQPRRLDPSLRALVVDEFAWRYVLHCSPDPRLLDFNFLAPFPAWGPGQPASVPHPCLVSRATLTRTGWLPDPSAADIAGERSTRAFPLRNRMPLSSRFEFVRVIPSPNGPIIEPFTTAPP